MKASTAESKNSVQSKDKVEKPKRGAVESEHDSIVNGKPLATATSISITDVSDSDVSGSVSGSCAITEHVETVFYEKPHFNKTDDLNLKFSRALSHKVQNELQNRLMLRDQILRKPVVLKTLHTSTKLIVNASQTQLM